MTVLNKNKMQDFALSSQNCDHRVLQLIAPSAARGSGRSSRDTQPYLTCTAPPEPLHSPAHGPGPHPGQPGVSVPVVQDTPGPSHAPWEDPAEACCSLSPAVALAPALFAFGWSPWFIPCLAGAGGDQPQLCFWAQSLQDGVQSTLTTHWTENLQKILKTPNCALILIWK